MDSRRSRKSPEGWHGWDAYAPFYDWENAQTLGRADVPFWRRTSRSINGRILELGCGTGRVSLPLMRAGARLVGIDRSTAMLSRLLARRRSSVARSRAHKNRGLLQLVQGDIRRLPFRNESFAAVFAPYGILQSLLSDRDMKATCDAVARVLQPDGSFIADLVPDLPRWAEYRERVSFRGRSAGGRHLTLIESVEQNRRLKTTTFHQRFVVRRRGEVAEHPFTLTFRTLTLDELSRRLARSGFLVERVFGDYSGGPWSSDAEVWIIRARRIAG